MKINKYCLHKKINEKILQEYSLFKLGEISILNKYAQKMAEYIREKVNPGKNYFIYATNKHPVTIYCKKCSLLLAEKIAEILNLPIVIAEYNYPYNVKDFYDDHKRRKQIYKPHLNEKDKEKFRGKKAIFIDDSTVTGLSLQVSAEELSFITDQIYAFTVIAIASNKFTEQDVNNFFEKENNISLVEIINKPGYIFTSHMLRVIDKLSISEKNTILEKISKEKLSYFKKAFFVYFDKNYQESNTFRLRPKRVIQKP